MEEDWESVTAMEITVVKAFGLMDKRQPLFVLDVAMAGHRIIV